MTRCGSRGIPARKDQLDLTFDGSTITVQSSGKWGPAGEADVTITMPAWMAVELSGVETDITVEGCKCAVHAETVRGDVSVKGGEGNVSLQSVEGSVKVSDVNGRVEAKSVNERRGGRAGHWRRGGADRER